MLLNIVSLTKSIFLPVFQSLFCRGDEILQVNQEVLRSWMDASSLPGSFVVKRDGALVEIIVRGSGLGRTTGHRAKSEQARTSRGVIRFLRRVSHRLRVSA